MVGELGADVVGEVADDAQKEDDRGHDPEGTVEIGGRFDEIDELFSERRHHGRHDSFFDLALADLEILFVVF